MRNTTVLDPLRAWSVRRPEAPALQDPDRSYTWHALVAAIDDSARALLASGARRGDRVGVIGPLSCAWAVAALGVVRAGCVLCPLGERLTGHELTEVVDRLIPTTVLASDDHRARLAGVRAAAPPRVLPLDLPTPPSPAPLPDTSRDPQEVVCVLPTSGSTGRPKGVVYTHEALLGAFFEWTLQEPALMRARALNVSAFSFAAGLLNGLLAPLVLGGSVVLLPRWDPGVALGLVRDERITSFAATTVFYEQMAALPAFADADLSSLTVAFTGGNPVTTGLIEAWADKGVGLRQAYGLTESLSMVTFPTVELAVASPDTVGQGGILTSVSVVDPDGAICPPGEPGEIAISGPGVAAGYWRDDALTEQAFGGGVLRTGDVGAVDEHGALRVVGRLKDVIISGGMNVYAAEVERAVLSLPGVVEAAVLGVPDFEFGETPALLVRSATSCTPGTVLEHCRHRLADYKLPRFVVLRDDPMPRTASMKIDKAALRREYPDIPATYERRTSAQRRAPSERGSDRVSGGNGMREQAFSTMLRHVEKESTDEYGEVGTAEPEEYRDVRRAELERDRVFGEVPFIVAHSSEIAGPDRFLTRRLPRNNVIVIRQRGGGVKAFVNACRHRGAQLVEEESGRCRLFSCPYHRWSYDTDGALRTVTLDDTFGEVDRNGFGLVELPVEERHGFVWIIDNPRRTIDVAAWLGPEMDAILGGYGADALVSVTPHSYDRPVNWKIMQDGFLDNYHVRYAHPNTAGKVLHTNKLALRDLGRHFWFLAARKSIDRFVGTDAGGAVDADIDKHTIESCFVAPNSMFLKHATHLELLTFRPYGADPTQSVMELRVMAPGLEASGLDQEAWDRMWAKNWKIITSIIIDEDFPILDGSQDAMRSLDAGTMLLGRNELGNHLFRRELERLVRTDPDAS